MKKTLGVIAICTLLISGCASTQKESEEKLPVYTEKYEQLAGKLDVLKSANIAINVRQVIYLPLLSMEYSGAFSDVTLSESVKKGHIDLLDPTFSNILGGRRCPYITSEEDAIKCHRGFGGILSPEGTLQTIEESEDGLARVYFSLEKLNAFLADVPDSQKGYIGNLLKERFTNEYTLEKFADAVDAFTSQYPKQDLLAYVSNLSAQNEARLAYEEAREKERQERQVRNAKEKQKRLALKAQFRDAQKKEHEKLNAVARDWWKNRELYSSQNKRGEKICSYADNKMGFIDDLDGENIRVLWKKQVTGQLAGFWFGNIPFSNMSDTELGAFSYHTRDLDEISWAHQSDVSRCFY